MITNSGYELIINYIAYKKAYYERTTAYYVLAFVLIDGIMTTTIEKETVLTLPYIRRLYLYMLTLGLWPKEAPGKPMYIPTRFLTKFALISCAISTLGIINYLYQIFSDSSFTIVVMGVINVILACITTMYEIVNKWSNYFSIYATAMMIIGCLLYNIAPIHPNYKNGAFSGESTENKTFVFSVNLVFPGFNQNDWFLTSTLLNIILSYAVAVMICVIDLLLILIVFQIIGHIFVLRDNFTEFPRPKKQNMVRVLNSEKKFDLVVSEMFDEEENIMIHKRLVESIEHHRFIVDFTQDLSDFFGPMLAASYLSHLLNCCLLLLMCTKGDAGQIISFLPLTVNIFGELIQLSVIFEIVGTVSEKLPESVYETPWECMNVRNRRTLCIFLQKVQTPIRVMALKTIPVGVTTMSKILKTTFSYYAFLQSME